MVSWCVMSTWSANFSNLRHLRPIPLCRVWDGKVQDLGFHMFSDFHPDIPTIFSHKMHQNDSKCKHIHQITAFNMTCSTSFFRIRRLAICAPSFWVSYDETVPTRSRGMSFKSAPCFRNTAPAVWFGFKPTPSFVMTALVDGLTWMRRRQPVGASLKSRKQNQIEWNICTLNSSAENFTTARKGASSGTVITWSMKGLTCHHIKQMLFQVHTSKQNCPQRLSMKRDETNQYSDMQNFIGIYIIGPVA